MLDSMKVGITGTLSVVVDESLTVPGVSDKYPRFDAMPQVFATGFMVAFAECAAMEAMAEHLEEGEDSVGIEIDVTHSAPTPVGMEVKAFAELVEADGRFLTFRVELHDEVGLIGAGLHKRAVINRAKFDASVEKRRMSVVRADPPKEPETKESP
ncbi:thioesterase family protein [Tessaracoccus massiliensis]|uniref:thioesterase family protein n=1 Tax=Tessaracoccus massiliensis TaxID=1522311 RepID=UPI00058C8ED1|nr:hotdog domain-containing protein [Tessaracoccus massiliensis]